MRMCYIRAARRLPWLLSCLASFWAAGAAVAGGFVVIVNKENRLPVDRESIAKIFTGEVKSWGDGTPVVAVDLPEDNPVRASFSSEMLGKTVPNVKALWAQIVFSGKALPPKQLPSDEEVKKWVGANKGAVGYIKPSSADNSVRLAAVGSSGSDAVVYVVCSAGVSVAAADVRAVFLGQKQFAAGVKLVPADNSGLQPVFLEKVLKMDAAVYTAGWTKRSFRDGSSAPTVKKSDAEVLAYIRNTPGACGYVAVCPASGVTVAGKF